MKSPTGTRLEAIGTAQINIQSKENIWATPVLIIDDLLHPIILGLYFLKITQSKIDFTSNNVEIGSFAHSATIHQQSNPGTTTIIPTNQLLKGYGLLLTKPTAVFFATVLILGIILTAVAAHTHCQLQPIIPVEKPTVTPSAPPHPTTWQELLVYGTSSPLTVPVSTSRSGRTDEVLFLEWKIPPILAARLSLANTIILGIPHLTPPTGQANVTIINSARCRFLLKDPRE